MLVFAGRDWNRGKESVGRPVDSVQDVRIGGVEDDVVAAAHHQDSLLNTLQAGIGIRIRGSPYCQCRRLCRRNFFVDVHIPIFRSRVQTE
jgi:hypothetical protein